MHIVHAECTGALWALGEWLSLLALVELLLLSLLAEPEVILRRLLVAVEALELRPLARAQLLPLLEVRRLGGSELG